MAFDDEREVARRAEAKKRERDNHDLNAEHAGQNTGRMARFLPREARAAHEGTKKRSKRAQADRDAFFLALMNEGALGGFIVDEVFSGKTGAEIAAIVAEVEDQTGLTFSDYAASVLGAEAAQRKADESEEDYHRRIVMALAEEMIDPVTGSIKPEYSDDPFAEIILRDARYQQIMDDVAHLDATMSAGSKDHLFQKISEGGYSDSKHAAMAVRDDGVAAELRDGQANQTDEALNSDGKLAESQSFFGSSLGPPSR